MIKALRNGVLVSGLICLALGGSNALATGVQASASGSSHFTLHNVFGLNTLVVRDFSWTATQTATGKINGWFNYQDVEDGAVFSARGDVTCLTIQGNQAWIGATIVGSNDPSNVGLDSWWHVTDNGEGQNAQQDVTTLIGTGDPGAAQAFCDTAPPYRFPWLVDNRSIQVRP
jgi:hypothetical protein